MPRRWLVVAVAALLYVFLWGAAQAAPRDQDVLPLPRLHPDLARVLMQTSEEELLRVVVQRQQTDVLRTVLKGSDRLERRQQLVGALRAEANRSTASLRSVLEEAEARGEAHNVKIFWASPHIALEATPDLVKRLALRQDVVQVRLDEPIFLGADPLLSSHELPPEGEWLWNLTMIRVDLAHDILGLDGAGVVVANMDTGVDWQHPALMRQYRGYNPKGPAVHAGNWYVATDEGYVYPGDGHGHGTHTMGTMVGDDGDGHRVGVAPGARWIAVKLFTNSGVTYESWIHDAFQWILAPEGDPALAPDIVNNSWGSDVGSDDRFRPDVAALRAAGILPIFSAGNNGPGPRTVSSPASYPESLAIGAVDTEREIASFSAWGPSVWNEIKPEVVAPGVSVLSTFPGGGYASSSGTSMAAPHAAGVAALLKQAAPDLTPDELEQILIGTATPIGELAPNNTSGWGLIDAYAAALRVTAHGEIYGQAIRADGGAVPYPNVQVQGRDGESPVIVSGDAEGHFLLALRPGLYDLTVSAFGYAPEHVQSIRVITEGQISLQVIMEPLPVGALFGRISDADTGAPISATLHVEDTRVAAQTDPGTGAYSLALPAGTWRVRVEADRHRVGHITATLSAGQGLGVDLTLPPAPRILLVDSGRWYYDSQIQHYEDVLRGLDYLYTLRPIRNPFGSYDQPGDRPTFEELRPYDVVIWSAPSDAPGLIGVDEALRDYLDNGGRLLLSGKDIAFWDGGGSFSSGAVSYFLSRLGIRFDHERDPDDLTGVPGSLLDGLTISLNTPDSAGHQVLVDAVRVTDPILAQPVLEWPDANIGGATSGTCRPYRSVWLGFGLEGAGPSDVRRESVARVIDWFGEPPAPYGLTIDAGGQPLIGVPGTTVERTLVLQSSGVETDVVQVNVSGGSWPLTLSTIEGKEVLPGDWVPLQGCAALTLTARIDIPAGLPRNTRSTYELRFTSGHEPSVEISANLVAKTPAPVLLVDHERFFNHLDVYTRTLDALGIPFDVLNMQDGKEELTADILRRYPIAIWVTGYDWFEPLSQNDEVLLSEFLDDGGRLLISSQDLIDAVGLDTFVRERLGVVGAYLSITATQAVAWPQSALLAGLGPWELSYPFTNWSDGLKPAPQAIPLVHDGHARPIGVAVASEVWRTAFFSFPLEAMGEDSLAQLLHRVIAWLSPVGDSHLWASRAIAPHGELPVALRLASSVDEELPSVSVAMPIPPQWEVVPDSLSGGWHLEPSTGQMVWAGSLEPRGVAEFAARWTLDAGAVVGEVQRLRAWISVSGEVTVPLDAWVRVGMPWLEAEKTVTLEGRSPDLHAQFVVSATNEGPVTAFARMTDTLPVGLALVPASVSATRGVVRADPPYLYWEGDLSEGETVTMAYRTLITAGDGVALANLLEYDDGVGRRDMVWTEISLPAMRYFPFVAR